MNMPKENENLTQTQINLAVNITSFKSPTPGSKGWHYGQFEPWATKFGYSDGKPIYASVKVESNEYHIYFLNDGHQLPIILKLNQTPADYDIDPI